MAAVASTFDRRAAAGPHFLKPRIARFLSIYELRNSRLNLKPSSIIAQYPALARVPSLTKHLPGLPNFAQ